MECRICNNKIIKDVIVVKEMMFGTGKSYPYLLCSVCGCLQIEQVEENNENLYPASYYSFNTYNVSNIVKNVKQFMVRCSVAKALGQSSIINSLFSVNNRSAGARSLKGKISYDSAILDMGCGDGGLIDALDWCGYRNLTGIDPFLNKDVEKGNYKLLKTSIENLEGEEIFDVIMLHHSFEHVANPFEVIRHIKRLLKKDGLCIIRIPVSDSYAFDLYKENWVQLDAPRHIFLHTNKSMKVVTERNDLQVVEIVNDSLEFQFIGSEQYKNGISLSASQSYYLPPYKKLFFNKKHPFSKPEITNYKKKATSLNLEGKGDQRVYYIKHAQSQT